MICHFSNIWVHFVFCQLNFIVLFPFLIKYYLILFIIIVFRLICDRPSGLLLFVPDVLFSILTPLFCVSSSVSLSYFVPAVPMRKCLRKHSCMSSSFPIVILNDTSFFPTVQLQVHNENQARYGRNTDALVNLSTKLNSSRRHHTSSFSSSDRRIGLTRGRWRSSCRVLARKLSLLVRIYIWHIVIYDINFKRVR